MKKRMITGLVLGSFLTILGAQAGAIGEDAQGRVVRKTKSLATLNYQRLKELELCSANYRARPSERLKFHCQSLVSTAELSLIPKKFIKKAVKDGKSRSPGLSFEDLFAE